MARRYRRGIRRGKTGSLDDGVAHPHAATATIHLLPVERVIGRSARRTLWQDGTVERFNYTRKNASRGRSPAHDAELFQRLAVQTRAAMLTQAQAVLDRPRAMI